jgi:hypothetical protein
MGCSISGPEKGIGLGFGLIVALGFGTDGFARSANDAVLDEARVSSRAPQRRGDAGALQHNLLPSTLAKR